MGAAEACYSPWQPGWLIQTEESTDDRAAFSWSLLAQPHAPWESPLHSVCAQSIQKFEGFGAEQGGTSALFPSA